MPCVDSIIDVWCAMTSDGHTNTVKGIFRKEEDAQKNADWDMKPVRRSAVLLSDGTFWLLEGLGPQHFTDERAEKINKAMEKLTIEEQELLGVTRFRI